MNGSFVLQELLGVPGVHICKHCFSPFPAVGMEMSHCFGSTLSRSSTRAPLPKGVHWEG